MPAYGASAYKKNLIRLRTTTHADIPRPCESSEIVLFSALIRPGTKYEKRRTNTRSPYSVQEKKKKEKRKSETWIAPKNEKNGNGDDHV
jgi:hypothetical protein